MQLELRANAICPRHQDRVLIAKTTEREETRKTAMRVDDTGANRRTNGALEALDDSIGGLERDARRSVGQVVGHAQATGSRVASKRSLSAAIGTVVGYFPVRQARQ